MKYSMYVLRKINIMVLVNFVFDYTTSTFVILSKLEESVDDGHG